VRVNDRGPFLHNRLIDLSYAAASKLGYVGNGTGLVEVEGIDQGAPVPAAPAPSAEPPPAENARRPLVEVLPPAQAASAPPPAATGKPKLYVQVGAFSEWDNAAALRTRLERSGLRPIFIQSVQVALQPGASLQRIYRVRIGPVAGVEAADRLTQSLPGHGIDNPTVVVE